VGDSGTLTNELMLGLLQRLREDFPHCEVRVYYDKNDHGDVFIGPPGFRRFTNQAVCLWASDGHMYYTGGTNCIIGRFPLVAPDSMAALFDQLRDEFPTPSADQSNQS
jgi:hypothetical protein